MNSSLSGKAYEILVASIVRAGTTAGSNRFINDVHIPWNGSFVDVEVKQTWNAEYGQKTAKLEDGVLKVPHPLFQECIEHTELFDGKIPPFLQKTNTTFQEWDAVKEQFADEYYTAAPDSISRYYKEKGNAYVQIRGLGLYHTGEDVCNFGVPFLETWTQLRIRCKRHGKKCPLTLKDVPSSVMASFWMKLAPPPSPYSLDDPLKLPEVLQLRLRLC